MHCCNHRAGALAHAQLEPARCTEGSRVPHQALAQPASQTDTQTRKLTLKLRAAPFDREDSWVLMDPKHPCLLRRGAEGSLGASKRKLRGREQGAPKTQGPRLPLVAGRAGGAPTVGEPHP